MVVNFSLASRVSPGASGCYPDASEITSICVFHLTHDSLQALEVAEWFQKLFGLYIDCVNTLNT